jgi:hypothetical protein
MTILYTKDTPMQNRRQCNRRRGYWEQKGRTLFSYRERRNRRAILCD